MSKRIAYVLLQCTWGMFQSFLGGLIFLITISSPHECYRGCIVTRWRLNQGLSTGLFIFIPRADTAEIRQMRVHEYGHTIQSLILGPLYLPVIGIPSAIWCMLPFFVHLREKKAIAYTSFFIEGSASKWGEKVTKEEALWN